MAFCGPNSYLIALGIEIPREIHKLTPNAKLWAKLALLNDFWMIKDIGKMSGRSTRTKLELRNQIVTSFSAYSNPSD